MIPDLRKAHAAALAKDTYLQKNIQLTFILTAQAHLRQKNVRKAADARDQWMGMVAPAAHPGIRAWFDSEAARYEKQVEYKSLFLPIIDRVVAAIHGANADALHSLFVPGSPEVQRLAASLKTYDYSVQRHWFIDARVESPVREGSRAAVNAFFHKEFISKVDQARYEDAERRQERSSVPSKTYVNAGVEKILFLFDGRDWKLTHFAFDEFRFYPTTSKKNQPWTSPGGN